MDFNGFKRSGSVKGIWQECSQGTDFYQVEGFFKGLLDLRFTSEGSLRENEDGLIMDEIGDRFRLNLSAGNQADTEVKIKREDKASAVPEWYAISYELGE